MPSALTRARLVSDKPLDLDKHRGMAAQKATDIRRILADVENNAKDLRDRQGILENQLLSAPAASWPEAAAKARYVLNLYAAGLAPADCPCRKPIDWRLTENRAMLICNEISFQAHCLGGCRSVSVAGSARGRDINVAATDPCSATNRPQETDFRCHRPIGVRWSLSPLPSRS